MADLLVFVVDVVLAGVAAYGVNWLGARILGRRPDDGDGPGGGWWRPPIPPPPRPHGTREAPEPRPHRDGAGGTPRAAQRRPYRSLTARSI
jgi:hypothetical protein